MNSQRGVNKPVRMLSRQATAMLLFTLSSPSTIRSEDETKTFDSFQCRYTLPAADWKWIDPTSIPNAICMARNGDGLVCMLTVMPAPSRMAINDRFVTNVDKTAYAPENVKKRGGRITTFKGLPCYENLAIVNGDTTAVNRYIVSNGY